MIIFSFILYYLLSAIQSLLQEIKEIKSKCIKSDGMTKENFKSSETPNPSIVMYDKAHKMLSNLSYILYNNN